MSKTSTSNNRGFFKRLTLPLILASLLGLGLNDLSQLVTLDFLVEIEQTEKDSTSEQEEKVEKDLDDFIHHMSEVHYALVDRHEFSQSEGDYWCMPFPENDTPPPERL